VDKRVWKLPSGLTLTGHSRSAETTGFFIPEVGWALDAGLALYKWVYQAFVTHGHLDHSFNLPSMLSRHHYTDIYAPVQTAPFVTNFMHSCMQLNDTQQIPLYERKYHVIPVTPGQSLTIVSKNTTYIVQIVECYHIIPCVGYCFSQIRSKLKEEYKQLKGPEIAQLRKSGVKVAEDVPTPIFAFLGDTTAEVYEKNPHLFEYPVIIAECTFLTEDHPSEAVEKGHTSWDALRPFVEKHPNITFVLIHFSLKYKNTEILEFFNKCDLKNIIPWVDSED